MPKDAKEGEETKAVTSMKDQDDKLKKEADDAIKAISGEKGETKKEEVKEETKKTEGGDAKKTEVIEAKSEKKETKEVAKPENKPEAKAETKDDAPPAASAQIMIVKSSDPICSSDPTDPACVSPAGLPVEKQVVYPIVPTAKDIKEGLHKDGQV